VAQVATEVVARLAATKKSKNHMDADKALKASEKGNVTMKWFAFISSFMLEKMCSLIRTGVRTDKGFKKVHLIVVAKAMFEQSSVLIRVQHASVGNPKRKV
jgi:hypothetical protein